MHNESYKAARTLATVEHVGETFRICWKRINGKPWRKYLALVHGETYVAGADRCTDPGEAAIEFKKLLEKTFASREAMLPILAATLERYKPKTV